MCVYHPFFLGQALRLLRAKCDYCHHLKLSRPKVVEYTCRLQLVKCGLLTQEASIRLGRTDKGDFAKKGDGEAGDSTEPTTAEEIEEMRIYTENSIQEWELNGRPTSTNTEAVKSRRKTIVAEFLKEISGKTACSNCRA